MTRIVWNGVDGHVEADLAVRRGYDFDGVFLYSGPHKFEAFEAREVVLADLPKDEDGEPDFDKVYGTETGRLHVCDHDTKTTAR